MTTEVWKKLPRFPAYDVSDVGGLRSYFRRTAGGRAVVDRKAPPQDIRSRLDKDTGRHYVALTGPDGRTLNTAVARLVLLAFVGKPPKKGMIPLFLDGNAANPVASNLKWGTRSQALAGREQKPLIRLTKAKVLGIFACKGKVVKGRPLTTVSTGVKFGVTKSTVAGIWAGKSHGLLTGMKTPTPELAHAV